MSISRSAIDTGFGGASGNNLMAVLARLLLQNPQLLQRIGGMLAKDVGQAPRGPDWTRQSAQGRTQLPEGSIGGGFLPSGLQLAGRLSGPVGTVAPTPMPSAGTLRMLPAEDVSAIRSGVGAPEAGNFVPGTPGSETTSELRNRVARSLLNFFGGDEQKAQEAYRQWLYGEAV